MKKIKKEFPALPGVYLFKNKNHEIIYIGKAKSLKDRIASYFSPHSAFLKIDLLMSEAVDIDYIVTNSELDALLLETELIQKYKPRFNVLLKDGQPFLYILFTKEHLPQMLIVRNKEKKGTYFGPFLQKQSARKVHTFLKKTFHLGLCTKKLEHGCLEFHLGICAGTCKPNFSPEDYFFNLELAQYVLRKEREPFLNELREKIKQYNAIYAFEKAQKLSNYVINCEHIFQVIENQYSEKRYEKDIFYASHKRPYSASVSENVGWEIGNMLGYEYPISTIDCFDISHFQGKNIVGSCVRFNRGVPEKNKLRRFLIKSLTEQNDYAALQEIVLRRYKDGNDIPDLILIDGGKGQLSAIQKILPGAPLASLAKREERLYTPNNQDGILLNMHSEAARLLIALRDYAHHFALSYHQLKRSKKE